MGAGDRQPLEPKRAARSTRRNWCTGCWVRCTMQRGRGPAAHATSRPGVEDSRGGVQGGRRTPDTLSRRPRHRRSVPGTGQNWMMIGPIIPLRAGVRHGPQGSGEWGLPDGAITGAVQRRVSVVAAVFSAVLTAVGQSPAAAAVTAVQGSAFGYQLNMSLFGGPVNTRGVGQIACTAVNVPPGCAPATSSSPSVVLPPTGGNVSQTDPDGTAGQVGPAICSPRARWTSTPRERPDPPAP